MNPCLLCDAKCCKGYKICVTPFDVLRIAKHTGLKPEKFAGLYSEHIFSYDADTVIEDKKGKKYLLYLKSPPCPFLGKGGKCGAYGFAPLVCRVYPYTEKGRLKKSPKCGIFNRLLFRMSRPEAVGQYNDEYALYVRIAARWNRKKGTETEAFKFILKEAGKETKFRKSELDVFKDR
jgi:Fe-S-cluster containining protein